MCFHIHYVIRALQQPREDVDQVSACVHAKEVSSRRRENTVASQDMEGKGW